MSNPEREIKNNNNYGPKSDNRSDHLFLKHMALNILKIWAPLIIVLLPENFEKKRNAVSKQFFVNIF